MPSQHDIIAKRIAKKFGVEYNPGNVPDIETPKIAIEVETAHTVSDGYRQLRGYRKPVYIAGTDDLATLSALAATMDYSVGVMDQNGNIRRPSSR